jgi:hypothetical protein
MAESEQELPEDRGDQVESPEPEKVEAKAAPEKTEEAAPEKTEEAAPEKTDGQTVPFSRFSRQNTRLREAEKRAEELAQKLAELEKPAEPAPAATEEEPDLDKAMEVAEKALLDAMNDNDPEKIMVANREIRKLDREIYKRDLDAVWQETHQTQESIADRAYQDMLSAVEEEFPQLDPASDSFDELKQKLVQDLLTAYEAQGIASDEALLQAAALVFPDSELARDILGVEPDNKAEEAAGTQERAPSAKGIAEKIAAAKATPPDLNKAGGENSDTAGVQSNVDINKLTDEEFDALPKETQKRARGDYIST